MQDVGFVKKIPDSSLCGQNSLVHLRHQTSTSPLGFLRTVLNRSSDSFGQNSGLSGVLSAEAISSETLKAGSSGEIEEGLGGVGLGETVTIDDSVDDGGEPFEEVGESLVGVTFGEAIRVVTEPIVFDDFSDAPCR